MTKSVYSNSSNIRPFLRISTTPPNNQPSNKKSSVGDTQRKKLSISVSIATK